jgi:transposase
VAERWPAIKKARTEGYTIVFVDESGLYLLPARVSTWAPIGETPVLRQKLTRDHLSVIGAISQQGCLYTMMHQQSINSQRCVAFLRHLLRQLDKVLVIWDGAAIHNSRVVKTFLATEAHRRVHLERLPSYAPECNPEEGVWQLLKTHELANVCTHNLKELAREVRLGIQRLRHKLPQLRACFQLARCV